MIAVLTEKDKSIDMEENPVGLDDIMLNGPSGFVGPSVMDPIGTQALITKDPNPLGEVSFTILESVDIVSAAKSKKGTQWKRKSPANGEGKESWKEPDGGAEKSKRNRAQMEGIQKESGAEKRRKILGEINSNLTAGAEPQPLRAP